LARKPTKGKKGKRQTSKDPNKQVRIRKQPGDQNPNKPKKIDLAQVARDRITKLIYETVDPDGDMGPAENFADIVKDQLNKDIAEIPGAGAAGGLGGGFIAFLDGVLKPGIDIVLDEVQLKEKIQGADFVLTGEGKIDEQSVMGKAPTGVSKLCKQEGVPVIAISGCVDDSATATHDCGITSIFSVVNYPCSLEEAMDPKRASTFVQKNTEEIFRLIKAIK
jgi:glycerate kinase